MTRSLVLLFRVLCWFWVVSLAVSGPTGGIKVTMFSIKYWNSSRPTADGTCHSREIIRCAVLCCHEMCISFVCSFDRCGLYQHATLTNMNRYYTKSKVKDQERKKRIREKQLLLMYPVRYKSSLRLQQVDLGTCKVSYYPLSVRSINAVVYIPWSRDLWVASSQQAVVKAYPLFKKIGRNILTGVSTLNFAVDEERQLVFIVTKTPHKTVSRVTSNGSGIETVYRKKGVAVFDICADPKGKQLIISLKQDKEYRVIAVRYHGKEKTVITRGPGPIIFCFDKERKVVYKSTGITIRKIQIGNSSTKMRSFGGRVFSLLYYAGNIYIKLNLPVIRRYNPKTAKTGYITNSYPILSTNHLNFCVVY